MIRLGFLALFAATVVAMVAAAVHVPSVGVSVIFFVVLGFMFFGGLFAVARGESSFSCPHCGKMVKLGAAACHHCGRSVVRSH